MTGLGVRTSTNKTSEETVGDVETRLAEIVLRIISRTPPPRVDKRSRRNTEKPGVISSESSTDGEHHDSTIQKIE